ncbi:MAG: tetratricopeptide repeat protein [Microcystis sp. M048S1]|uniref:CHAT domain-containing protein n=1 Tax=unclassified Microcystis TaxID=2643300 RepID=UPI001197A7D6|nr:MULTISPECIES: tetratricopeptide repeat protein [unclassified Microcystis]MCA2723933.1 tetratricopeptide repeat protein [Microcystis sp. M176S2]MCA2725174.1 tetratricopeptide repeat protein [Microcystis sp. M166S2]MCA2728594.1 tetratricopeptide repeat protein [Microcystis sp. M162S2]MCA2747357.1 tetratricopeptide repeat protein [Microcystis sp. M155S2]MCA2767172.1 tetratricopeptide repeat protein [Microcystis sp. M152S2]
MLSLLKKLWNWLKSLFIASPKAINPKEVKNTPPEPSDGEYEGILMGLFEQVAAGTTTGGLRGWLYSRHCDDKKLARWLGVKSEEWLQYPEDYQTLGRDLAALGKVMTGNLGEVSQRISLQLRDAVRDVSGVEEENLGPKETDLTEVVQDAEFWFEQGNQKVINGDFIGAIASYDRALEFKPDYHGAWYNRGIALGNLGRFEQAIASWDRALEIKPDYHEAWGNRGVALYNLGRFEEVIASYDKALEIKPDLHQAWYNRGVALADLGRWAEAIASWDQALEIKPDKHEAWNNRGIALGNLGRFEQAIASYDRALEIKPDDHLAWLIRGGALYNLGRFEEVIASYDRALEIKPDDHEAWYNRGIALVNLGRLEEAIASYDRALEFKPDLHQAWYNRGNALADLGRLEEAIASYDRALEFKPDDHEAWYNRGIALGNLGRLEEAIASWDQALEIQPDFYHAWYNRGIELKNLGRYEEAIASYDRALEIKPDFHLAWYGRGNALGNLGRFEQAIASFDQALEIKPDYHLAWDNRGWAVCSLSKNRVSTPSLEALIYRKPIVALNDREPHIFALREALPHLIQGSPPWGQIYRYLGEAYLEHSQYKENASPYWREAIRHYQTALPILSEKDFPEDHLEILQGLIRAHLSLQEIPEARFYQQQGRHLFTRLRAQKRDKPAFERKFSSFSHLEIDLLIEENHPLDAIEQAEFYKNRCLTWILDNWQENPTSPDYATIQSLTGPNKAIIYWYLSEDNLTTFIITAEADPVILEPEQRRQPARQFRTWLTEWDKQYRDYASKKETENKQNHPWRLSLNSRFAQLKRILQIDKILEPLPVSVDSLILIPHRDLHRFPLHTLFPEKYTATYLPSAQVGLRPQSGDFSYSPLLSVEDPKTEQKPMDFAQLESAIISHILQPSQRISPKKASRENVRKALENAHKTFHFTGHGFYDSFRPQESAIALSDGLLTVRDINKLNLSSYRLVCLAACETALTGKDGITTEYVGLVSAFRAAGATNVVSTLWPVKEISSAWFMVNFYQRLLAGESPALALKNTQNWLKNITWQQLANWIEQLGQLPDLREGVDRLEVRAANILKEGSTIGLDQLTEYSDPYHWAAYTLTGQD